MSARIIIGSILIACIGLIAWGVVAKKGTDTKGSFWQGTTIACLPEGHTNLGQHIHQQMSIAVDGKHEPIPSDIGISETCMAELHTHDVYGKIHVETVDPAAVRTLGDFFAVWGRPIEREGYELRAWINTKRSDDPAAHQLADGDEIHLEYISRR